MADSQHWGHADKRACRKESAETAKQCKSSLYSREFSQLTLTVNICFARLPEMSEIQKCARDTTSQVRIRGRRRTNYIRKMTAFCKVILMLHH